MPRPRNFYLGLAMAILCPSVSAQVLHDRHARTQQRELPLGEDPQNQLLLPFMRHLAEDQRELWTAPSRARIRDLKWIVPIGSAATVLIASDYWTSKQVPNRQIQNSRKISDYAVYSLAGTAAGSFICGHIAGADRLAEAGLLSSEAAINSVAVAGLLETVSQRNRPYQQGSSGQFFSRGSSFPSEHSALAWSIAGVWAHEYPGAVSQTLAYSLASAVTVARVTGKEHFPSDAVAGSALGWYLGREVYRLHHDKNLGGAPWAGDPLPDTVPIEHSPKPQNMGSPDVAMDSWIYPAFDRLIALGYIKSAHTGIRPWTRNECARLLEEAQQREATEAADLGAGTFEVSRTFSALESEFAGDSRRLDGAGNLSATVDSLYARTTVVSGAPLRDGYHFGQTIVNDYGRPYGEGDNTIAGINAHAAAGPVSIVLQGEYEQAPAATSDPRVVLADIAAVDWTKPLSDASAAVSRARFVQGQVAFTRDNVQVSFGRQSLWLGPGWSGPLLFSNNAQPMAMFRIASVSPYTVPLVSQILGSMTSEFFFGRLAGQHFEGPFGPVLGSQPFLHGSKVSFHPTENLELGMGFTAQVGGTGNPLTWASFLKSVYSHRTGANRNPAKRLSEFDAIYRPPGLRDWVQLYVDAMVIDEYSPIGSNRPAMNPGIYFPQLPKLHPMDLRLEGVTTDLNVPDHFGPGAFYWDDRYHSGYTNGGNLIGSWVGRRGRGAQGWLTYHFSPQSFVQFAYRSNDVDRAFLGGGGLRDITARGDWKLTRTVGVSGTVQHESWHFPVLYPIAKSNILASLQLTFWPKHD